MVGDGCGKMKDCGGCPDGQTCGGGGTPGVCATPVVGCTPKTCSQSNGQYCGAIGDGCGGRLDCGDCTKDGETCGGGGIPGVCGKPIPPSCMASTCAAPGGTYQYCDAIGDGCGHVLSCGDCPAGEVCGGGGIPNVCAKGASCTAATCEAANGTRYCGDIGDGCGRKLSCPATCPAGQVCGAVTPHVCGPDPTTCTVNTSCTVVNGQYCGDVGDGCGHLLHCPATCSSGQTCNDKGLCVPTSCTPITCGGKYCGDIGDGCGNTLHCGDVCPAGTTCGGGGRTNVCFPDSCVNLCRQI
jgi:hypothetical protein